MKLNLEDYNYELPEDKIAKFPCHKRSDSKLLVYRKGRIEHFKFDEIPGLLPQNALLVFNNTKVIQARLVFYKDTGARIEIFCLEPLNDPSSYMLNKTSWHCLVGNKKKWKDGSINTVKNHKNNTVRLTAQIINSTEQKSLVEFEWTGAYNFYEILEIFGETPLPPYLKRNAIQEDIKTYQTVYAKHDGAVAAPTAGLHFTNEILESIENKGIRKAFSTLHVSAGTFQPIKEKIVTRHPMHEERISFRIDEIKKLIQHNGPVIPVGTTSLRSLESLYWFGIKLMEHPDAEFNIEKLYPYQNENNETSYQESFATVVSFMEQNQLDEIWGKTSIFIFPSYKFRVTKGLITNYHQPKSTLILLVATLIGETWKDVYKEALENGYRFLSYGDSSLLLPNS